jgi:EAL and modified HD-GYP domain-containing signal transduction protein
MIDRDADPSDLEKTIRRDAALAYRLLRYINSAAFGLPVEIQSFRHAVMMLGYERLKRWLLLMLMTASKDANMQPVMFASFRRGLFMEHLVGQDGNDAQRDEVFILGVLSLIDKLFREPLPVLLEKLYVPSSIREALIERTGPVHALSECRRGGRAAARSEAGRQPGQCVALGRAVQPGADQGGDGARTGRGLRPAEGRSEGGQGALESRL